MVRIFPKPAIVIAILILLLSTSYIAISVTYYTTDSYESTRTIFTITVYGYVYDNNRDPVPKGTPVDISTPVESEDEFDTYTINDDGLYYNTDVEADSGQWLTVSATYNGFSDQQTTTIGTAGTYNMTLSMWDGGVRVVAPSPTSQGPFREVNYTFIVENTGNGIDSFSLTAESSQGWQVDLPGGTATPDIDPGESINISVKLTIPPMISSGTIDTLTLTATSNADESFSSTNSTQTTIVDGAGITVSTPLAQTGLPGETLFYTFIVTNYGNVVDSFNLALTSSNPSWTSTLVGGATNTGTLGIGSSKNVDTTISIPSDAAAGESADLTLTATSVFDNTITANATITSTSVQIADVLVTAPSPKSGFPDQTITYTFIITNLGNGPDAFNLYVISSVPTWDVELESDAITQQIDSGESLEIHATIKIPPTALAGDTCTLTLTATSVYDANVNASGSVVTATLQVATVSVVAPSSLYADPEQTVYCYFTVQNLGNGVDSFNISVESSNASWSVSIEGDATNTGPVFPGASEAIGIIATTPDAQAGDYIHITLTAVSVFNSSVTDSNTTTLTINIAPDVTVFAPTPQSEDPGHTIFYTFIVVNTGNAPDSFDLSLESSNASWATGFISPSATDILDINEETAVDITVIVPLDAEDGDFTIITLTATSNTDPNVSASDWVAAGVGQVPGVKVIPPPSRTGFPGETITYKFIVINEGNGNDSFVLDAESSNASWLVDIAGSNIVGPIAPYCNVTVNVTITIPFFALVGDSAVLKLTATSVLNTAFYKYASVKTETKHCANVTVIAPMGKSGEPGEILTYTFIVRNDGNGVDSFDISVTSSVDYWFVGVVGAAPNTGPIPIHSSKNIDVFILIPAQALAGSSAKLTFTASSRLGVATDSDSVITEVKQIYRVDVSSPTSKTAPPGKKLTFTFIVSNLGNGIDTFRLQPLSSDTHWEVSATANQTEPLNPSAMTEVNVTVTVPPDAKAHSYSIIILIVISKNDQNATDIGMTTAVADQLAAVKITPPSEQSGRAGETIICTFTVTNTGNGYDAFELELESSNTTWLANIVGNPSSTGAIPPGGHEDVNVSVSIPTTAGFSDYSMLTLKATSLYNRSIYDVKSVGIFASVRNNPPKAIISSPVNNSEYALTDAIIFDASMSSDPDNDILRFVWDSSIDGNLYSGQNKTFTKILSEGKHTITLTVYDGYGGTDFASCMINVVGMNEPPVADAGTNKTAYTGERITFDGSNSYDPDGDQLIYNWDFGDGTFATGKVVNHTYRREGTFVVTLVVDDGHGHQDADRIVVRVRSKEARVTDAIIIATAIIVIVTIIGIISIIYVANFFKARRKKEVERVPAERKAKRKKVVKRKIVKRKKPTKLTEWQRLVSKYGVEGAKKRYKRKSEEELTEWQKLVSKYGVKGAKERYKKTKEK